MKTIFTQSALIASVLFLLVGTASANIGTEAGNWEFSFSDHKAKTDIAAESYHYDQNALAKVGTEAGNWQYNYYAPESKADNAARSYSYNQEQLSLVGTEAGNWRINTKQNLREKSIADKNNASEAICKGC